MYHRITMVVVIGIVVIAVIMIIIAPIIKQSMYLLVGACRINL